MFFKRLTAIALVILGALGCARENQTNQKPVEVQLKNGGTCLKNFGAELSRFFDGRMNQSEVASFWDCSSSAIEEFQRLTAGENGGDTYTPEAIRRFLYKHKFLEQPLSDDLLVAVMDLKAVFLAGSVESVTRAELSRLQDLMMEVKGAALDLNPHWDVVLHRRTASDQDVSQAGAALNRTALRLATWLDRNQRPYTVTQLANFVAALKAWMSPGSDGQEKFSKLEKAVKVLRPAKRLLVGGDGDTIGGQTWLPLWTGVGRVLNLYLDLRHAFGGDLNSGLVRGLLPEALVTLSSVIEDGVKRRPEHVLPMSEWNLLFQQLQAADLLGDPLTAANLTSAFEWFTTRGLGEGPRARGVTVISARKLRQVAEHWQDLLGRVAGQPAGNAVEWARFQDMLHRSIPLEWDSDGRLVHPEQGVTSWTPSNQLRMVWPFVVLDWLRGAYVGSADTLSEEDMNLAVGEILPILQQFGWLLETKLTIGKRLLREADLFTLASDGNFALDLGEATRYSVFVAAGFRDAQVWLEEAKATCPTLEAECVRRVALNPKAKALEPFPLLRRCVLGQPPEEFLNYVRQAEETILGHSVTGEYGAKDMLQVLQLVQYVETFLRIYDANRKQTIDLPESLEAYIKYGPTLSRLLSKNGLPPDDVLAFFTFMMKYGDTPFSMFGGQIRFNHWKWHRNHWEYEANRLTLMGILNQLSKL